MGLDTVGGALEAQGRAGDRVLVAVVRVSVLVAAVLGVAVVAG